MIAEGARRKLLWENAARVRPLTCSGPFKFKSYTRGATFEGERNPDYFVKDRPYLDGYKFYISTDTTVRATALRSGRAWIEFRTLQDVWLAED